jgi:hypothetical protein
MPWDWRSPGPQTQLGDKTIMTFEELEQIVTGLAVNQARNADVVDSLVASVQGIGALVQSQQGAIDALQQAAQQQAASVERLITAQIATFDRLDVVITRIDEMQSEVRGLQTETRRIVDGLYGRANDDD